MDTYSKFFLKEYKTIETFSLEIIYVNKNLTLKDRKWICPNCGTEIIRDENAGKNLRDNAINLLTEEISSVLGMEHTEVMSMEGMEAT